MSFNLKVITQLFTCAKDTVRTDKDDTVLKQLKVYGRVEYESVKHRLFRGLGEKVRFFVLPHWYYSGSRMEPGV